MGLGSAFAVVLFITVFFNIAKAFRIQTSQCEIRTYCVTENLAHGSLLALSSKQNPPSLKTFLAGEFPTDRKLPKSPPCPNPRGYDQPLHLL